MIYPTINPDGQRGPGILRSDRGRFLEHPLDPLDHVVAHDEQGQPSKEGQHQLRPKVVVVPQPTALR